MSFLTVVEQDLEADGAAALNGAKACIAYVDNVFITEIEPALQTALLAALKTLGQDALAAIIAAATPA